MATTATPIPVASFAQMQQFTSRQRSAIGQNVNPSLCFTDHPPKIETFPRGYPSLSAFLSSDRDFSMFRCFARLQARMLLHKQDELADLEQKLDELDRAESAANPFHLTTNRRGDANPERQALLGVVEGKLKDYNTLLESFLGHLERPQPEETDIKSVIHWMDGKKPLTYAESTFLDDWSDLKRARNSVEKGGLEVFLGKYATLANMCGTNKLFSPPDLSLKSDDPRIKFLQQSKIIAASRTLTTILAVFSLVVPIAVLYSVNSIELRLCIIAGFTAIFSSALCWLTSSRNYEIFSATAAYCAVMVVFVGNLPGS
ncbi:hypothetical protein F4819DRAFT_415797 [Hypoxylon fuscum]|nr:hypothetical protein F4819DRAFT_415797 [Hypoxylon fuscum]